MPQRTLLSVGIDVSKDTLVVAIRSSDQEEHVTVPNSPNGLRALHAKLRGCSCPLIMESTGRYHILPAFLLTEKGYDVRVVNPLQAKRYMAASTRKQKTDKTDATALAQMGVTDQKLPDRFSCTKEDISIRQKIGLLSSLEKHLQSLVRSRKTYRELQKKIGVRVSAAERGLARTVEKMDECRERLEAEIQELILRDDEKRRKHELACTIPGIAAFTGSLLCQVLDTGCEHAKQWIAFVGYDVSLAQSGTWRGRGRLSKRGNGYFRKRLYCAAWGAIMHDPRFRAYYQRLKQKGHSHRAATVIVARKLLRILFSVLKDGQPFAPERCLFPA
jgi:transposase